MPIYNPLPNGLHGKWTRAALAAGKHVLCEKPFTANAAEAREIADLTAESDRVVMEAFHYRYHPLALRVEEIIASGELGKLRRVEAALCFPLAAILRHPLQLFARRRRDHGRRLLRGPHGPHVRRFHSGSRFGTGEVARSPGRPGHDGRIAVCRRTYRPGPLLDVVDAPAADQRQSGRRTAANCESSIPSCRSSFIGSSVRSSDGKACRAFRTSRLVRLSARRIRRRGAARRAGQDNAGGCGREHDRHRRDLPRGRPPAARAELKQVTQRHFRQQTARRLDTRAGDDRSG